MKYKINDKVVILVSDKETIATVKATNFNYLGFKFDYLIHYKFNSQLRFSMIQEEEILRKK